MMRSCVHSFCLSNFYDFLFCVSDSRQEGASGLRQRATPVATLGPSVTSPVTQLAGSGECDDNHNTNGDSVAKLHVVAIDRGVRNQRMHFSARETGLANWASKVVTSRSVNISTAIAMLWYGLHKHGVCFIAS